jgi:hypothetical protein
MAVCRVRRERRKIVGMGGRIACLASQSHSRILSKMPQGGPLQKVCTQSQGGVRRASTLLRENAVNCFKAVAFCVELSQLIGKPLLFCE